MDRLSPFSAEATKALKDAVMREKREALPPDNPSIEDAIDRTVIAILRHPKEEIPVVPEHTTWWEWLGRGFRTLVSILFFTAAATFLILISDRKPPVDQIANSSTGIVHPLGPMLLQSDVFRHRQCDTIAKFTIYDAAGQRHFLPMLGPFKPFPLGKARFRQSIEWSAPLAVGPAKLFIELIWRCNPSHDRWPITQDLEVPFEVVP